MEFVLQLYYSTTKDINQKYFGKGTENYQASALSGCSKAHAGRTGRILTSQYRLIWAISIFETSFTYKTDIFSAR